MKKSIFIFTIITTFFWGCVINKDLKTYKKAEKIITPVELQKNVNILASDWMKGRNAPSKELDSAARYIACEFQKYGIKPVNDSYFQKVPLVTRDLGKKNYFKVTKNGKEKIFKLKTDFIPFEMSADSVINSQLVFAGYGITAPEFNYDDYKDIDVKGKVVLVLTHVPNETDENSLFGGMEKTDYSKVSKKVEIALNHGAIGMIVITDPVNHKKRNAIGYAWPSLSKYRTLELPVEVDESGENKIPVIHADEDFALYVFSTMDTIKKIQKKIDQYLKPASFLIDSITVSIKTNVIKKEFPSMNVVGFLEGSDPVLKNEILVIGAHYDHVGFNKNHKSGEDYIFNGADDNASGTAGVLAIAKTFSKLKNQPKRSLLFILFTAEEKGLYGSYYYVNNPLFPLKNTVAMINLDMISRNNINSLTLEGASKSPDIAKIIKDLNIKYKFNFTIPKEKDEYLGGSDHFNFYEKGIPMIFFFADTHKDYHTVNDNPDKINADKAAKIARLAFCTAWYIANDNKYYKLIRKNK